jgi:hypothetical protein
MAIKDTSVDTGQIQSRWRETERNHFPESARADTPIPSRLFFAQAPRGHDKVLLRHSQTTFIVK